MGTADGHAQPLLFFFLDAYHYLPSNCSREKLTPGSLLKAFFIQIYNFLIDGFVLEY